MSTFSIGGLATGLDTQSIISKLMDVERAPEKILQNKQKTYQQQSDTYKKIEAALKNLQDLAEGINTSSTFSGTQASVGDSTVLTAASTSAAAPGSHTLQIASLARSQRQVSTGYADGAVFNTGTFTIDDGAGTVTSVDVAEGSNTLQGIAASINNSGANVTASVINDGSGTPNRLVIVGKDTKNYTVDFSGLQTLPETAGVAFPSQVPNLLGSDDPSYQGGAAASFTLDGIPMTKENNSVSDAIPGVTFNLLKEGGSSTFTVSNDTAGVTKKITDFVAAYNSAITLVNQQSSYNADTKTAGVLSGDSTLRQIQTQLRNLLTATVSGASGKYTNLAQLGITSSKTDGTVSVDSGKLSSALSSNFNGVVDLFTHNGGTFGLANNQYGIAQQFNLTLEGLVHPYEGASSTHNGLIETRMTGLQNSISDIDKQVSSMEDRIAKIQDNLQKQFTAMESMVSNLQSQGNSLLSALGASLTSNTSK